MVVIRELMPDDAPAVARIESMFHDGSLADGAEAHHGYLSEALDHAVNLSFGAFKDGQLVGYLLCYGFEPTAFTNEEGRALYVEDVAVLPTFRVVLPGLIRRFMSDVSRYFPRDPIEAHTVASGFALAKRHEALLSRFGLSIQRYEKTGEVLSGQERYLLRWRQIRKQTKRLDQLLERLPAHSIEHEGSSFELKVVRREADWPALASIWDTLLLATPDHTVFQSYAYQRLWWSHFGRDSELFIVLIVQNGAVSGIAPLRIEKVNYGRRCRQLCFIGTRWEVDRPALLIPASDMTLVQVLVTFLARRTARWDICDFHEQTTGSPLLRYLEDAFRSEGFLVSLARDSDCPYLPLQGTWQQFLAGKSQRLRKNLKASDRKLRQLGDWQYRTYDTAPEVLEQLEVYRTIEARSWKNDAGIGVSRSDEYFAFYRELAEIFAHHRAFVVRMTTVDGRALAGTFGLVFDGVYYSLQIAHDREADRCSPGTHLEALEIQECFDLGYREYEFLGGFLNNKSRWTTTHRHTTHLRAFRRSPFFIALYLVSCRLKPWVKELIRPYMKSWQQNRMEEV
jgi:CelD/BcsL family acetyltransferase involved in cellulose biosynthesis